MRPGDDGCGLRPRFFAKVQGHTEQKVVALDEKRAS